MAYETKVPYRITQGTLDRWLKSKFGYDQAGRPRWSRVVCRRPYVQLAPDYAADLFLKAVHERYDDWWLVTTPTKLSQVSQLTSDPSSLFLLLSLTEMDCQNEIEDLTKEDQRLKPGSSYTFEETDT